MTKLEGKPSSRLREKMAFVGQSLSLTKATVSPTL